MVRRHSAGGIGLGADRRHLHRASETPADEVSLAPASSCPAPALVTDVGSPPAARLLRPRRGRAARAHRPPDRDHGGPRPLPPGQRAWGGRRIAQRVGGLGLHDDRLGGGLPRPGDRLRRLLRVGRSQVGGRAASRRLTPAALHAREPRELVRGLRPGRGGQRPGPGRAGPRLRRGGPLRRLPRLPQPRRQLERALRQRARPGWVRGPRAAPREEPPQLQLQSRGQAP